MNMGAFMQILIATLIQFSLYRLLLNLFHSIFNIENKKIRETTFNQLL